MSATVGATRNAWMFRVEGLRALALLGPSPMDRELSVWAGDEERARADVQRWLADEPALEGCTVQLVQRPQWARREAA